MPSKLKYTFEDYINNPSGRGSAVVSVNRDAVNNEFNRKLSSLESSKGKITYKVVKTSSDGKYFIHFKIPSESVNNFYYDTVVEFIPVGKNTESLKKYNVKFFSNDPSFIFTYGYAFRSHGILITELEKYLPFRSLNQKANTRNPDNTIGYVKNIYFAYLVMVRDNLFDKIVLDRICKTGTIHLISKEIKSFDKREVDRKNLEKQEKEGLNKKQSPKHSQMVKSKFLATSSKSPTTTKYSSKVKTVSGLNKQVKTSKKTKKV